MLIAVLELGIKILLSLWFPLGGKKAFTLLVSKMSSLIIQTDIPQELIEKCGLLCRCGRHTWDNDLQGEFQGQE